MSGSESSLVLDETMISGALPSCLPAQSARISASGASISATTSHPSLTSHYQSSILHLGSPSWPLIWPALASTATDGARLEGGKLHSRVPMRPFDWPLGLSSAWMVLHTVVVPQQSNRRSRVPSDVVFLVLEGGGSE